MLRSLAASLAFLWAVNPVEADAFSAGVVQDFDGVGVENGDEGAAEVRCEPGTGEKDGQHYDQTIGIVCDASRLVTPCRTKWSRGAIELPHRGTRRSFHLAPPLYLRRDDLLRSSSLECLLYCVGYARQD